MSTLSRLKLSILLFLSLLPISSSAQVSPPNCGSVPEPQAIELLKSLGYQDIRKTVSAVSIGSSGRTVVTVSMSAVVGPRKVMMYFDPLPKDSGEDYENEPPAGIRVISYGPGENTSRISLSVDFACAPNNGQTRWEELKDTLRGYRLSTTHRTKQEVLPMEVQHSIYHTWDIDGYANNSLSETLRDKEDSYDFRFMDRNGNGISGQGSTIVEYYQEELEYYEQWALFTKKDSEIANGRTYSREATHSESTLLEPTRNDSTGAQEHFLTRKTTEDAVGTSPGSTLLGEAGSHEYHSRSELRGTLASPSSLFAHTIAGFTKGDRAYDMKDDKELHNRFLFEKKSPDGKMKKQQLEATLTRVTPEGTFRASPSSYRRDFQWNPDGTLKRSSSVSYGAIENHGFRLSFDAGPTTTFLRPARYRWVVNLEDTPSEALWSWIINELPKVEVQMVEGFARPDHLRSTLLNARPAHLKNLSADLDEEINTYREAFEILWEERFGGAEE